ncbi:helix-turn-helix domain-containing protein [Oscillospiraceae bacterium MB08-C2-2]|nr:helix-turn-helix domain-containing protein [Oscillospiraceae bacterium MB08-C2-2]
MANCIKELRTAANISQIDLANYLNVSQGTLSNWERGLSDPDRRAVLKLAQKFDVSWEQILCITMPLPPPPREDGDTLISQRITQAREAAGMSSTQLAYAAAIDSRTMQRYESGEALPRYSLLVDVARALGTTTDYLLGNDRPADYMVELPEGGNKYDERPGAGPSPREALRIGVSDILKRPASDDDLELVEQLLYAVEKRLIMG